LGFIKKIYDWVIGLSNKKNSSLYLFIISFIESSFFPVPPDVLLIPLCIGKPKKALRFAFICTIGSVLGGVLGYYIGMFFMEGVGYKIIDFYSIGEEFLRVKNLFNEHGVLAIGVAGFTPIPYKVFTIASGVMKFSLLSLILTSFVARGLRFFIVSILLYKYGDKVRNFIEKYFNILSILFMLLLILGYVFIKFII
jgi:membrane protein YqaA with SNARE-associated domain